MENTMSTEIMDEQSEIEQLRDTVRRLNRRCQRLESGVKQTVEDCRRQDITLGRALANVECDRLTAEVRNLQSTQLTASDVEMRDTVERLRETIRRCADEEIRCAAVMGELTVANAKLRAVVKAAGVRLKEMEHGDPNGAMAYQLGKVLQDALEAKP